jgi:signal transduction histidine kinase/ActR/RegA family two-component response regulator
MIREHLVRVSSRLVDRFLPPGLTGDDEVRGRFFVQAWLVSLPFCATSILFHALSEVWGHVALNLGLLLGAGTCLALFRRFGREHARLMTHVAMTTLCLFLGPTLLTQTPPDVTDLAVLMVVPLLASFMLGPRTAWPWVVLPASWAVALLGLASQGYTLPQLDPMPMPSAAINIVMVVVLLWLFAFRFDDLRAAALARARAADKAKSTFLATVSHEIRTPMNGVLGMTEVLLGEALSQGQREKLEVIQRSGQLLVSLINDLLDQTKLESGKLALDCTDFELAPLLRDLESLYGPLAADRSLSLTFRAAPRLPAVFNGDALRLRQVLGNLVNNAVKFTPRGGVTVAVDDEGETPAGRRLRFAVEDTGIGISPQVQARLFTAFEQGDASTTRKFGGTGLGLALSQELATLMGTSIAVESVPGRGSRFSFALTLPIGRQPRQLPVGTNHRAGATGAGRLPVLVVDDNDINLKVAAALVEKSGFGALTSSSGQRALELLGSRPVSLVLLDCHMPEMDGFETARRIRALPEPACQTPIVAVTASAGSEDVAACYEAGMDLVLAKPVSLAALNAILERVSSASAA